MSAPTTPRVTLITPTHGREHYLRLQYGCLARLQWHNLEWLILDDSPQPSAFFSDLQDPAVHYRHSGERLSIGAKRNALVAAASGEIIMHFDDDDYYAPGYVAQMVAWLEEGADLVKLQDFFLYSTVYQKLGYWRLALNEGVAQIWSPAPIQFARLKQPDSPELAVLQPWGYGFSYAYRRQIALDHPFPDMDWNEDKAFVAPLLERYRCRAHSDHAGLCLHILHASNTSNCFPQYELPPFALDQYFPELDRGFLGAA